MVYMNTCVFILVIIWTLKRAAGVAAAASGRVYAGGNHASRSLVALYLERSRSARSKLTTGAFMMYG